MATMSSTPAANGENRRKSGRVSHAPRAFSQEQHHGSVIESTKRKRQSDVVNGTDGADDDEEEVEEEEEEEEEEDESEQEESEEGEPDEEEIREKKRKQRSRNAVAKPAAKRPRTKAGASTTLAIRSANVPSKTVSKAAKQKARSRPSQFHADGLYADVFGRGLDAERAAARWHSEMEADHVGGIVDIVNFVLQVAGCDARVDADAINDPDNVPDRLGDVLTEYAKQKEGEYPLASRQKQYHGMKDVFADFFRAVPHVLHNSGLMYDEVAIYDNLHIWTATMSGASYRSFRHTATVAAIAMMTGITEVAKEVQKGLADTKKQLEVDKKKKSANKGRIATLKEVESRDQQRLELLDQQLKDGFDTVYVHRYRDVEEKLRVECAAAMGTWILNYRTMFLEGTYLRYLGWVMSDPHAHTRLEVVRALRKIYGVDRNLVALHGFTDRFRARIIEMGARDADISVRVEAIGLLSRLRDKNFLEPDDIEVIGQMIFDNEPQIRKAIAHFFISNIEDLYDAIVEDFKQEEFDEALPDADDVEDFEQPSKLWIKFKCLAQTLRAQIKNRTQKSGRKLASFDVGETESRYMVATQAIFSSMPQLQHWEALAGYLLHDHSSISTANGSTDISAAVQEAYKLESGEDIVLLDVLYCAAKLSLQQNPDSKQNVKSKRTKAQTKQDHETAAHNLSTLIPQLHNKYGSIPQAARSILRLHQLFDPDLVDDIHEGEGDHSALLDDVNKSFTTHSDAEVLAEASRALRVALAHENSKEAADKKVGDLWQDLTHQGLGRLLKGQNVSARGALERPKLQELVEVTARLAQLASVKDCSDVIEGKMSWPGEKGNRRKNESLMDVLLQIVKRGEPDDDTPKDAATLEDQVCRFAIKILSFYYRWKIVSVQNAIKAGDRSQLSTGMLTNLAMRKNDFIETLLPVITSRRPLDGVRSSAILSLIDLYLLFATIRHVTTENNNLDEDVQANLKSLVTEINATVTTAILETHEKMERRLARKTNKKNVDLPLERAQRQAKQSARNASRISAAANGNNEEDDDEIDRPPEDSDDEDVVNHKKPDTDDEESSSEDGGDVSNDGSESEDSTLAREAKKKAALVAETSLCELAAKLVLAVLAGIVPKGEDIRTRLQLNRTKLGKSYTQVIAYIDDKKEKSKPRAKTPGPKTPAQGAAAKGKGKKAPAAISEPTVLEDDDIEDSDNEEVRREEGDPETLREEGLNDDPVDEQGDEEEDDDDAVAANAGNEDEDEIMGE